MLSSVVFFSGRSGSRQIIDHIPGLNHVISAETVQKKFGIFSEPLMVGTILGILLRRNCGYDFQKILLLGISIGSVMFILPHST